MSEQPAIPIQIRQCACCDSPADLQAELPAGTPPATVAVPFPLVGRPLRSRWFPDPARMKTAGDLCRHARIRLSAEARPLLTPDIAPREFFRTLMEHDCLADARRVLANALPKRRALWWGCLCAMDAFQHRAPQPTAMAALEAVVQWVRQPDESRRRVTSTLGQQAGVNTMAGSLAMATFFSGGSVSPEGLPEVRPRPFVTGRLVGVAVYLASVTRDPRRYRDHLRNYLTLGRQIAAGEQLWIEPGPFRPTRVDPAHASNNTPGPSSQPNLSRADARAQETADAL